MTAAIHTEPRALISCTFDDDGECSRCRRDDPGVCGRGPYLELFVYDDETESWEWMCNLCGLVLSLAVQHCPAHAPTEVPGLTLDYCWNFPPHRRAWSVATDMDDWHGSPCGECTHLAFASQHVDCAHARHARWRSTWAARKTQRVLGWLRLVKRVGYNYGPGCRGCATFQWRWSK
jgi:hypothetical protein